MADTLDLCGELAAATGYTYKQSLEFFQTTENGPVVDLTGWTADWEVRDSAGASVIRISTTNGAHGQITIDGAGGVITLRVNRAKMKTVAAGIYRHELRTWDGTGLDVREFSGDFVVEAGLIAADAVTEVP